MKKKKSALSLALERIPWIKASMERRFNMRPATFKDKKTYSRTKDKVNLKKETEYK